MVHWTSSNENLFKRCNLEEDETFIPNMYAVQGLYPEISTEFQSLTIIRTI